MIFFFFQAEDGIRDADVTGVQTCALPIWLYKTNSTANQGQNLILISPETDNLGNGGKRLRFWARAGAASNINQLEIVRADGNDATATFTVIQTINVDHLTYEEYIVPLPVTTDDYFGFRLA